jgi:lysophospholipase L1-like esterase
MSSKHRAPQRRGVPRWAVALTAVVASATLVACFVTFWPSGSQPSAASEPVGAAHHATEVTSVLPGLKRLVVYGHSMPAGGGASQVSLGYAQLTADATGLQLLNRSEGGTSALRAANHMAEFPSARPGDVVVIHTGMNDIFRKGDAAAEIGREGIERMLSSSSHAGRRVLVLECQPSNWLDTPPHRDLQTAYDAWNAMIREEAEVWPDVDVLDTCATWDAVRYTNPPQYHPDDEGHALIAEQLTALLVGSEA